MTLMDYTAQLFRCTVDEMYTKSRKREIVSARQVWMSVMRDFTTMSLAEIGDHFGKDHATVFYSIKVVKNLYSTDRMFRENVDRVYNACHDGTVTIPGVESLLVVDYMDEDMMLYADLV